MPLYTPWNLAFRNVLGDVVQKYEEVSTSAEVVADELFLHLRSDVLDSLWRRPTWLGSGCISHEEMERFRRLRLKLSPHSLQPSQHSEATCPGAGITVAFFLEIFWLKDFGYASLPIQRST